MTDLQSRALLPVTPEEEAVAWAMLDMPDETRAFSADEIDILTGGSSLLSGSGVAVSAQTALQVTAVFACCRVIAEDVAKMRRTVMRRRFVAERNAAESHDDHHHPLAALVADYHVDRVSGHIVAGRPNTWMTGIEFWEYLVFGAALMGMSAAWIVRDPTTDMIVELLPLRHGACQPEIDARGWVVGYRITGYGETFVARTGDVLILRGPMRDEVSAFEPVRLAREAIGLATAIERSQTKFHRGDMRPSGVLQIEMGPAASNEAGMALRLKQIEEIRTYWRNQYGSGGDGGIAVLDKKFSFQEIGTKSTDAQTIENRRFQIEEVCRVFRVAPSKIMHQGAAQRGSVEQDALSHVSDTAGVWAKRCEEACARDLVDPRDPMDSGIYVDFDDWALVRGTLNERMTGYQGMLKAGWTPNEVRTIEGWNLLPIPEADRPQFLANNTGLTPTPLSGAVVSRPAKGQDDAAIAAQPQDAATPPTPLPLVERPRLPKPAARSAASKGLGYVRSLLAR